MDAFESDSLVSAALADKPPAKQKNNQSKKNKIKINKNRIKRQQKLMCKCEAITNLQSKILDTSTQLHYTQWPRMT